MAIRHLDRVAAAEQTPAPGIELERAEAINGGSAAAHLDAQIMAANVPGRRPATRRR